MSENITEGATRWWWVRHAPVIDHAGRIYGQRDVACDTSDDDSFRALAETLPIGAQWVTSQLSRARDTAAVIRAHDRADPSGATEPAIEDTFAEQHFGDWQGKSWDEIRIDDKDNHAAFWKNPLENAPPGGESFAALMIRVAATIDKLNETHTGRDIIAVTHGGTIRGAVALALGLAPAQAMAIKIDNLSLTRLDYIGDGLLHGQGGNWRVVGVNQVPWWMT